MPRLKHRSHRAIANMPAMIGAAARPREPRRKVLIHARMRSGGAWTDVCIRNLSSRGMLLQTANPPDPGTYVEILRGDQIVIGRAIWAGEHRFGVRTQACIDMDAIIREPVAVRGPRISTPGGRSIPDRRADIRRPQPVAIHEQVERSRRISAVLQFGFIIAASLGAAILGAITVHDILSKPLQIVSAHLSDNR
jgi:hypothetical protein